jgi:SAM-dependent methyltransferase
MNTLKIGFFTSLRVNIGDEFIREGIRAILDRLEVPYYPLYVNKVDQNSIHQTEEDEIIAVKDKYWDSDVFIQAGAPVYWNLTRSNSSSLNSAWYHWAWQDRILNETRNDHPSFINLGAGSCQPWGANATDYIKNVDCVCYARKVATRSLVTAVRDPVAAEILTSLAIPHVALPCPAFLAAERHQPARTQTNVIGVNFMPLGSHYDLLENFNEGSWLAFCIQATKRLRKLGNIVFICHDIKEKQFAMAFAEPTDILFYSTSWRDYLDIYSACNVVLANRVHGAVCAAGFGVPSIILGNDTRAQIGDYIGLPRYQSGNVDVSTIVNHIRTLYEQGLDKRNVLIDKRKAAMEQYCIILRPFINKQTNPTLRKVLEAGQLTSQSGITPTASVGSVAQLMSEPFRAFMIRLNDFAEKYQLRQFTNWTNVWEYPWTWFHGLHQIDWEGIKVLDIGSELSPMPWFLAALGADVTLIERDSQWVGQWRTVRDRSGLKVKWHIVSGEILPIETETIDVVTSYSVIEHQPNKDSAVNEIIRVMKHKGILAISFDICEPDMGMTFPAWNGTALTLHEFELLIWDHPQLNNDGLRPSWNIHYADAFIKWHLQSAEHHNYIVGASLLSKK